MARKVVWVLLPYYRVVGLQALAEVSAKTVSIHDRSFAVSRSSASFAIRNIRSLLTGGSTNENSERD